jgi:hypothetical protein
MEETPVDPRSLYESSRSGVHCCPGCGSFLDAPRVNPYDGEVARKCCSCREWFPVETVPFDSGTPGIKPA